MKKRFLTALTLLSLLSLVGCSLPTIKINPGTDDSSDPGEPSDPGNPIVPEENLISSPDFSYRKINSIEEITYLDLFNLHNKVEITIDIDTEELDKIQEDNDIGIKPEIYRYAKEVTISLTNDGNTFTWTIKDVGIRQKGNTSRNSIMNGYDMNLNHYKLSFDETFTDISIYGEEFVELHGDLQREERDFLGLTGLDFKWNKNYDSTYLKEIYSSYMLRSAGIIVQHIGLSVVKFNYDSKTKDFGLCFLFEPGSKSLIKNALKSNDKYINMSSWKNEKNGTYGITGKSYGDMYKGTYGSYGDDNYFYYGGADFSIDSILRNRVGPKTDPYGRTYPVYERKTNKSEDYDDAPFKNIVSTLNNGSYSDIEEVVDLEYFAIEEAVMFFLGNPDSMRYNYNNIEVYIRRTDGKMVFIPIDNDRTLGIGKDWDRGVVFSASRNITPLNTLDVNENTCRNPLFSKTILSQTTNECQEIYKKYITAIADSDWAKNDTFISYFNILSETYSGLAYFSSNGQNNNVSFLEYISNKLVACRDLSINSNHP